MRIVQGLWCYREDGPVMKLFRRVVAELWRDFHSRQKRSFTAESGIS